jgi:hypothetical protein
MDDLTFGSWSRCLTHQSWTPPFVPWAPSPSELVVWRSIAWMPARGRPSWNRRRGRRDRWLKDAGSKRSTATQLSPKGVARGTGRCLPTSREATQLQSESSWNRRRRRRDRCLSNRCASTRSTATQSRLEGSHLWTGTLPRDKPRSSQAPRVSRPGTSAGDRRPTQPRPEGSRLRKGACGERGEATRPKG